ncbi:MAG TPA: ribosome-associated translation inhibitor RaiA [bacterium]|nr:ribosome-associated translation inhibitor RaiA [bacterium]
MKVNVTFRHMEPDDELKSYVTEKVLKLAEKYLHKPNEAVVVLTAEKFRRIAEITIKADNTVLTGKEETEDTRGSIDLALDKLEIQARRRRTRVKSRQKGGAEQGGGFAVYHGSAERTEDEDFVPGVIKEDKFVPKPMTVEDSLIVLEDSADDFLVFRNAETFGICVVYRRPDGNYGLIEPEAQG